MWITQFSSLVSRWYHWSVGKFQGNVPTLLAIRNKTCWRNHNKHTRQTMIKCKQWPDRFESWAACAHRIRDRGTSEESVDVWKAFVIWQPFHSSLFTSPLPVANFPWHNFPCPERSGRKLFVTLPANSKYIEKKSKEDLPSDIIFVLSSNCRNSDDRSSVLLGTYLSFNQNIIIIRRLKFPPLKWAQHGVGKSTWDGGFSSWSERSGLGGKKSKFQLFCFCITRQNLFSKLVISPHVFHNTIRWPTMK